MDIQRKPKGQSRMDIQRKPKGQSRMDNPEKTKGAIKNGQSRETGKNWAQKIQDEDKHTTHHRKLKR